MSAPYYITLDSDAITRIGIIAYIREYRGVMNEGLREAKEAVETIRDLAAVDMCHTIHLNGLQMQRFKDSEFFQIHVANGNDFTSKPFEYTITKAVDPDHRIQQIKELRTVFCLDLKEAKDLGDILRYGESVRMKCNKFQIAKLKAYGYRVDGVNLLEDVEDLFVI